jgi:hypothetical protein
MGVAVKIVARPKGLVLDANAIVPADGSMRQAEHVVCDQPGVVRSRQTNSIHAAKPGTDYRPIAMVRWNDEIHAISWDGSAYRFEDEGAVITGNATRPTQAQLPRLSPARGSLYHTSTTGIQKFIAGDSATTLAGVEAYTGPMAGGVVGVERVLGTTLAGGPLPGTPLEGRFYFDDTLVREGDVFEWYKTIGSTNFVVWVVIKRTDANDYVRRSPPTRLTFNGTAVPSTDAFLWQTYTVTAADVSAGYFLAARVISSAPDETDVFIPVTINDSLLGEALYTNPSQLGALGARYAPPLAAEIAQFGGCTWYGNTISKHRLTFAVTNVSGSTDVANVDDENPKGLLGAITAAPLLNGTTTNGSPVVTGVSDDIERFLRVGQYVTDASNSTAASAGTAFPADTLILSWVTGGAPGTVDITVNKNATATGARDILIGDVVSVGGRNFYAWAQDEIWSPDTGLNSGRRVFGVASTVISASGRLSYTAQTLAAAINYESIFDSAFRIRAVVLGEPYVYSSTVVAPADLLLEEIGVGGSAFTVDSSNDTAFSPNLPVTSENDAEPARLWWSDPDEPESVPLPNFVRIGEASEPILALTPLRSSLLVWKTDGLYRVTGTAPDGWRVDPVDPQVRLLSSGVVDTDQGFAYAWTDKGVVQATESGIRRVSTPIDEYLAPFRREVLSDDLLHSWLICWRTADLVLLAPQAVQQGAPQVVLALSTETGAWTTFWNRGSEALYCATYDAAGARLYWSRESAWEVRRFADTSAGYDVIYSITVSGVDGDEVTIDPADVGTWLPRAGDWLRRVFGPSSTFVRIVSVSGGGLSDYVLTTDGTLGTSETGTFSGIEGLACVLEWQSTSPPGAWAWVREQQVHVDGVASGYGPTTVYLGQGATTSFTSYALIEASPARPTSYSRPYRYGVPRAVANHAHYYPRVHLNALGYGWRLHELAVIGEPVSDRVRR